jgi:hypothetical protein
VTETATKEAPPVQTLAESNRVVQGLWIGPELSAMERLSVASFMRNGHEYHLYVYEEPRNVPDGTVVRDAGEILPASRIFQYRHRPSYAGFANFFRYKLLLERGGWWADLDTVCLRPFDFPEEYVFASELSKGLAVVTSGVIKAAAGSEVMAYAWGVCQGKEPGQLAWGETGPRLVGEAVEKFSLERYRQPCHVFCPLSFPEWRRVLEPDAGPLIDERAYAVHLWNEMWRAAGQDKDARYPAGCLYERLKRSYLRPAAPRRRATRPRRGAPTA